MSMQDFIDALPDGYSFEHQDVGERRCAGISFVAPDGAVWAIVEGARSGLFVTIARAGMSESDALGLVRSAFSADGAA